MKTVGFNKVLVTMIILATAPYAQASALSGYEIQSVRSVLRALNVDEAQLSNEEIEAFRNRGDSIRSYEKSKSQMLQRASDGEVFMTCGGGSHGSGNDPV